MRQIIGIDAGGTFTDAVIWDADSRRILDKIKVPTHQDELSRSIAECLEGMHLRPGQAQEMHISTTLTVNSILENKMIRTGLIIAGGYLKIDVPAFVYYEVPQNKLEWHGDMVRLSPQAYLHVEEGFTDRCQAVLISAYGRQKTLIEKQIKTELEGRLGAPVFCSTDFSDKDTIEPRTVDALTRIGLSRIVSDLIDSAEELAAHYEIPVPPVYMTGTGQLISAEEVRNDPLQIIFSGPVGSYYGSTYLTREKDYMLLDMGGTSLDITQVKDRQTRFTKKETQIGRYVFEIERMDIQSFASGGDSKIRLDSLGKIRIGPKRAMPLCILGDEFYWLADEFDRYRLPANYDLVTVDEFDCFIAGKPDHYSRLRGLDKEIYDLVREKPHSLFYIADRTETDADALKINRLLQRGILKCASLTSTDILHAEGTFTKWDRRISTEAVRILAEHKGWSLEQGIREIKNVITSQIVYNCMQSIALFEKQSFLFSDDASAMYMIKKFLEDDEDLLGIDFALNKPIVGVGAPAAAWLPEVASVLDTDIILPKDREVACALGAAAGEARNDR